MKAGAKTNPEFEFLLYLVQVGPVAERSERVKRLLRAGVNWACLLKLADAHGLTPLIYWRLRQAHPSLAPQEVLDKLRQDFTLNSRRNLARAGELSKLVGLFEASRIPAIPFKGPTLAEMAYGHVGLREFSDLDVLVAEQDVTRAKALLISAGYQPEVQLSDAQEADFIRSENALLFSQGNLRVVELHWELMPKYLSLRLEQDQLRGHLEPTSPGGKKIMTLCREDLLLFLCAHGAKHYWGMLGLVCDVAHLSSMGRPIDWPRVVGRAAAQGGERVLSVGLLLASDLLGAPIPQDVRQVIQADLTARVLANKVREWYFRGPDEPPAVLEQLSFHFRMRERLWDKALYCLHITLTPSVGDWRALRLPSSISFLYHLFRPLRLIRDYGWRRFKSGR